MSIHGTKRPTYEEILADLDKDYKVKLPDRVAVNFYDSFAHAIPTGATSNADESNKRR